MVIESRYTKPAWFCAIPFPVLGVATGIYLAQRSFDAYAESARLQSQTVCGLPAIMIFPAMGVGGLLGIVAGGLVAEVITWLFPSPSLVVDLPEPTPRERMLAIIPLGSTVDTALQAATEDRWICQQSADVATGRTVLLCMRPVLTGDKIRVSQMQIECADGKVSDITCQLADGDE